MQAKRSPTQLAALSRASRSLDAPSLRRWRSDTVRLSDAMRPRAESVVRGLPALRLRVAPLADAALFAASAGAIAAVALFAPRVPVGAAMGAAVLLRCAVWAVRRDRLRSEADRRHADRPSLGTGQRTTGLLPASLGAGPVVGGTFAALGALAFGSDRGKVALERQMRAEDAAALLFMAGLLLVRLALRFVP